MDERSDIAGLREALTEATYRRGFSRPGEDDPLRDFMATYFDHDDDNTREHVIDFLDRIIRPWLAAADKPSPTAAREREQIARLVLDDLARHFGQQPKHRYYSPSELIETLHGLNPKGAALVVPGEARKEAVTRLGTHLHRKGIGCAGHRGDDSAVAEEMHRDDAYDIYDFLSAPATTETPNG